MFMGTPFSLDIFMALSGTAVAALLFSLDGQLSQQPARATARQNSARRDLRTIMVLSKVVV
jgi:hypothetical protein